VLCQEHGLTPDQVVAIANNDGGRPALETVQRLLPVLCKEHGLTPHQVVAIACNQGGTQTLEIMVAQLSRPGSALAALPNDRLVALACLGGSPALDAVIKQLPHAPLLIRRANRRIVERAPHRVADPAQIVQVLSLFQCHSHPAHAFDDAMRKFGMSSAGLVQLFRRVGVTEVEARRGTLPPASQRWQRILQASRGQPAPAPPQQSQQSQHAFANSLEQELDAPSPALKTGQALASSSRKRPRSVGAVNPSPQQPAQARLPEQPDALHALLSSGWSTKRARTKVEGGLQDPGTPTDADLTASNSVFVGQDATSVAGAAEDFPFFDEEEMDWLNTLLPSPY